MARDLGARDDTARREPGGAAPPGADPAAQEAAIPHERPRSGGTRDEPRIVEPKVAARAGDRHRENLYALVIGIVVVAVIFAILYFLQIV